MITKKKHKLKITYVYYDRNSCLTKTFCEGYISNIPPLIDNQKMTVSTYGHTFSGQRLVDYNIRQSKIHQNTFNFDIEIPCRNIDVKSLKNFEYIEYYKNGKFAKHRDRIREPGHEWTICIYPPQNVSGGELILYKENGDIFMKYPMPVNQWHCLIFPIGLLHESLPIISGVKKLFKGIGTPHGQYVKRPWGYLWLEAGELD